MNDIGNIEKPYEEIEINSLDDLKLGRMEPGYIFRGQPVYDWKLEPAISRKETKILGQEEHFKEMLIDKFKKKWLLPIPESNLITIWHYWPIFSICQHYRIPTPLLDWTFDWRIAAFFAVVSEEYDNCDGVVWSLDRTEYEKTLNALCVKNKCKNRYENISKNMSKFGWESCKNNWSKCNPIFFIDAGATDLRMLVQSSVFSYSINGFPEHDERIGYILGNKSRKYFKKHRIRKELKNKFRTDIEKLVPRDKIYPNTSDPWFNTITNEIIQSINSYF
jgi:hypothetical protein